MIITYFRSSSYNTWEWCPHKYFIEYVLGVKDDGNKKAEKGNVVHKALELLAKQAFAKQNNKDFWEIIKGDNAQPKRKTIDSFVKVSYELYSNNSTHEWTQEDYDDCKNWTYKAIEYNNGMFDPRKLDIVEPELFFDFEIVKPWSKYYYELPDGKKLEGYLSLKGTIDLVTKLDNSSYEIIDWKTGRRLNWATGKEKTLACFKDDPQIRIYHYAISKVFPDIENIIFTVYYINDGGPFSVCFEKKDLPKTEEMIKNKFEKIRKTTKPRLDISWKCKRICHNGMNCFSGKKETICETIKNSLDKHGIDATMKTYGNLKEIDIYGMGGGTERK